MALSYQQLGQKEQAEQAFRTASQYLERYRADPSTKYHHDVMIAEVMLQEAKAAIAD